MSSKPPEPEIPRMKLEEIHATGRSPGEQDQQGNDLRSKRFGPEIVLPRYEFRTSNKNEIRRNVSAKRRVESSLPGETSTKRRRTPAPTSNVSGGTQTTPEKSLRQGRQQIGGSSSEVSFQKVSVKEDDFVRVINRRIQVYWNLDEAWYTGLIKRYDPTNKLHHVVYDDGEEEWVSLERDTFKIEIPGPGEFSMIPNRGIRQSKRDGLEDRSTEHNKHGGIDRLQQVGTDCLQKNGIAGSQKKTSRRKALTEEQKGGIDGLEKRNAKRVKRFHGIDGSGIECARSLLDLTEKVTSNEDRKGAIANVFDHSSSGADDGDAGSREASFFQSKKSPVTVYTRRSRPKSSLNADNSGNGGRGACNRAGAQGGVSDIGVCSSPCTDLGSHKVCGNAYFYKRQKKSIYGVVDSSTPASSSGAGETCIGSRADEHADIEDWALGDRKDMESEKASTDAEFQIGCQNLKSDVGSTSGVGKTCMGSKEDEHVAIGASELANCGGMELEKALVNVEFQNCPQKLKGGRGNEHSTIGALASADHRDMELEKVPMNSELQNFPQNLESNIDNASVSTLSSRFVDCTRSKTGENGSLETATSAANKKPVNIYYSRKRCREPANTECNEVPVKRIRKLNLEETEVSPNAKGKEIIAVSMMICRGIPGERESENSRPFRYDKIPSYRFDKAVSMFKGNTSGSTELKLEPASNLLFSKSLNVSTALKVHMSQLHLREPSYWQCIASGLQLYKVGPVNINRNHRANIECAKLLSWENLMVFFGSIFRFLNAGFEPSSSSCHLQMALQQFEVGSLLNSRTYNVLPLWECLQSMIMRSDVQIELLIFDTMSNKHKLCFWGPFSEVLCNFSTSLASLMNSAGNRNGNQFPVDMFGAARPVNLNVPIQSIIVKLSSLQSGAWSPLICNFENLHNMASANWNECNKTLNWLISSSKNLIEGKSNKSILENLHRSSHHMGYRGKALVRAGALCKYKQGAEVVNVVKRSVENQHFTSSLFQRFNSQYVSAVCVNQSKRSNGRIVQRHQPVPSICMKFVDSPNFFQYLHLKPLFGKVIHSDYSQSDGLLLSEEVPNKPTIKRGLSIHMHELVSEDGDLKNDKCSAAPDHNNSRTLNNMIAPLSALSSGFDINVTGTSSEMLSRQKNLVPVSSILKFPIFPILKFQRCSTDERSWHLAGISVPSLQKGRTSRNTARVDSLQSRHSEPDLNRGHFVRENKRDINMIYNGIAYGGRMESSQSGCSHSISDNADEIMLKSERSARRGRPSRQQKKEKYKDVDIDSQTCATNILIFGDGQNWRESGAEVALEALSLNECVLNVKLNGLTRFRYKAQEPKISRAQEQKLPKAGEHTLGGNPNFHTIIWSGGQDWNLEFTERKQWSLFRKMYEECYSRNLRAASIKNIPIPTVREINVDDLSHVCFPFERPMNYIQTRDDEVSRALAGNRVVYDMDSDDEEWLCRFNSSEADYGVRANKVSEDAFEGVIDVLEKAAFMQECDFLAVDDALQLCSELAPVKVLTSIHAHWLGKRKKKGTTLIREFQTSSSKRIKRGGKSCRGKTFRGQHSGKSFIGQPYVRNWEVGTSSVMQHQFNVISSGSEGSPDAVDLNSDAYALEAIRAAHAAKQIASIQRKRANRLLQVADLKTCRAVRTSRKAEEIREFEQARLLGCQTSEQSLSDSRIIRNVNASGGSMSSLVVQ